MENLIGSLRDLNTNKPRIILIDKKYDVILLMEIKKIFQFYKAVNNLETNMWFTNG